MGYKSDKLEKLYLNILLFDRISDGNEKEPPVSVGHDYKIWSLKIDIKTPWSMLLYWTYYSWIICKLWIKDWLISVKFFALFECRKFQIPNKCWATGVI